MNTRKRITAIPALIAAGAFTTLPGMLKTAVAQHAHGEATPAASQWSALGLPELNLTVTAEAVEGVPGSIEAGRYLVTVTGTVTPEDWGKGVLLLQLPEGLTMDDVMAQVESAGDAPPEFYYQSLLPGGPMTGGDGEQSITAVIDLAPGEWVVAGAYMSTPPTIMTATGEMPADLPEPESTATVSMYEMVIEITEGELTAGENLLKIENTGEQAHFVEFERIPDGATTEDVEAALHAEMMGTPVAADDPLGEISLVASSGDLSPGTTMWLSVDFEPGSYAGFCFAPDMESGMPHAYMGMYIVFEIAAS